MVIWATFPTAAEYVRTALGGTAVWGRVAVVRLAWLIRVRLPMSWAATTTVTFVIPTAPRPATTVPRMMTSRNATTDIPIPSQKSVRRPVCRVAAVPRTGAEVAMAQRASFESSGWTSTRTTLSAAAIAAAQPRRDAAAGPRYARRLLGVITSSPGRPPERGDKARHEPAVGPVLVTEAS